MYRPIILASDLSGIGKVALTNAIPVMASLEIETVILPSAILSSHTGGFKNVFVDDYTDGTLSFLKAWKDIDIFYDGIVTGYLKTEKQINAILDFKKIKSESGILIVDPIMADSGKFYTGFDSHYLKSMNSLCKNADYIIPNLTEACLLADIPYIGEKYSEKDIENLIYKLLSKGIKNIIITGISFDKSQIGAVSYSEEDLKFNYFFSKKIDAHFFGTGDLFTAVVSACIFKKINLEKSVKISIDWLSVCLENTMKSNRNLKYGVCFEKHLPDLVKKIKEIQNLEGNYEN